MKTIAFDVMGNDNGVKSAVLASVNFCKTHLDYYLILVGDRNQIKKFTKETEKIKILHTVENIDNNKNIMAARNKNSSMVMAIKLVKNGKADVVISSGSSKHYIALCTIILGRIKGISRPAFMSILPTIVPNRKLILLDVGANLEVTSKILVEWARLGSIFSEEALHIIKPRIALNNIGIEDNKGHPFQIEANKLLKKNKKINYIGFIEPKEILNGNVDVIIADGYSGNLVLKSLEGAITSILKLLKITLTKNLKRKTGALLLKGGFNEMKKNMDYRNSGFAWVLGTNGFALKTHGSADEKSYKSVLSQVYNVLENDLFNKLKEKI